MLVVIGACRPTAQYDRGYRAVRRDLAALPGDDRGGATTVSGENRDETVRFQIANEGAVGLE